MSSFENIANELKGLEYEPFYIETSQGKATVIRYPIKVGKYTGELVLLGFSFHGEECYPEYPPHWIHISPPYDDQLGGAGAKYEHKDNKGNNQQWLALSRPPKDFWDDLPTKHMSYYLDLHIERFCKNLK